MAAAPAARAAPAQKTGEIPVCSRSLGPLAVVESQGRNWWSGQRLASPTALIKVFVNRSRCFTLVDRGVGLQAIKAARGLAAVGELLGGSNRRKSPPHSSAYQMDPDVVPPNHTTAAH